MTEGGRRKIIVRVLLGIGLVIVLALLGLATLLGLWPVSGPDPSVTALPRSRAVVPVGHLVFDSDRSGNFEIYSMSADGKKARQLTKDARFDSWWGRISPNRQHILFYRTPKGSHDTDYTKATLWVMASDGSSITLLRGRHANGWRQQGHAEWSPDGRSLVMFGGSRLSPQIYVTSATGQNPVNVSRRGGTNLDPSYAPDGRRIVFIGCPKSYCKPHDYEVLTIPANGGKVTQVTKDRLRDHDPYYSPDGKRLAWLTEISGKPPVWDIRVSDIEGTDVRRLIKDRAINSRPEWSRDGKRIYFHRLAPRAVKFQIFSVAADGTGLRRLAPQGADVMEYPST